MQRRWLLLLDVLQTFFWLDECQALVKFWLPSLHLGSQKLPFLHNLLTWDVWKLVLSFHAGSFSSQAGLQLGVTVKWCQLISVGIS